MWVCLLKRQNYLEKEGERERSLAWVTGAQGLGPSSLAFSGALKENWNPNHCFDMGWRHCKWRLSSQRPNASPIKLSLNPTVLKQLTASADVQQNVLLP